MKCWYLTGVFFAAIYNKWLTSLCKGNWKIKTSYQSRQFNLVPFFACLTSVSVVSFLLWSYIKGSVPMLGLNTSLIKMKWHAPTLTACLPKHVRFPGCKSSPTLGHVTALLNVSLNWVLEGIRLDGHVSITENGSCLQCRRMLSC